MRYLLTCSCGNQISVARSQAGTTLSCPSCGANNEVPTVRNLAQLPEDIPAQSETLSKSAASGWSLPLGIAAALCFLTLLITWGIGGVWGYQRWNMPTPFTIEDEIAYGNSLVDQSLPSDLWDWWSQYRVEGLGKKQPSNYFLWKNYLEERDKYMYSLFAAGGIALLGLVATAYLGRRKT